MSESLHNMDDLFKKALQDNTDMPSESVWESIDKNLDKRNVVSILKKYNKLKWVAALLLLFTSAMAIYTFHVRNVNKQLARNNSVIKQKNNENKKSTTNNTLTDSITAGGGATQNITRENHNARKSQNDSLPLGLSNDVNNQKTPAVIQSTKQSAPGQNEASDILAATTQHNAKNKNAAGNNGRNQTADNEKLPSQGSGKNFIKNSNARENVTAQNKIKEKEQDTSQTADKDSIEKSHPENRSDIALAKVKSISEGSLAGNMVDTVSPIEPQRQLTLSSDAEAWDEKNINYKWQGSRSDRLNFNKPTRFSLNIFYSPDISFKTVSNNHPMYRDEDRDEIKKEEWVKYASTVGLKINYHLKNHWQIGTGISYSTVSTEILPKTIYARPDNNGNFNYRMNCSAGYSYIDADATGSNYPGPGDSIKSLTSNNRLAYLNIPLTVGYTFAKKRWSITPSAGVAINFLSKGQIVTTIATNTGSKNAAVTTVQGLKQNYMSATISVMGQYTLGRNFALSFEPTSRFGLETINKDASVNTVLNSFGFAAGVVIKL